MAKKSYNSGWSLFGFSDYDESPRYYKPKPRAPKRPAAPAGNETSVQKIAPYKKPDGRPVFLMVSLRKQHISVYDTTGRIAEAPISSGRIGFSTPTGVFSILEKNRVHFSNLYESAPMPNMQRLTWSGVALHAGDLPGYPASHGCIRLPRNFSKQLFDMTRMGTRVVVTRDPVEPVAFSHAKLFGSYPPDDAPPAPAPSADSGGEATVQTVSAEGTNASAMTSALGISTADAAPLAEPQESPVRAKRRAEKAEAEAALEAAKAEKQADEDLAKAAVAEADAAKLGLRNVILEVGNLKRSVAKAEADRVEGDRQFAAFYKKYAGTAPLTDEQRAASIEEEKALEANALALSDAVDAARAAVDAKDQIILDHEAKVAEADQKRRDAIHRLSDANVKLKTAGVKVSTIRTAEALRKYPVSVYISRKTGKLYVRQNQKPVFDAPVTFTNPDQPLGTHVYTALEYANDARTELSWNAISIPASSAKPDTRTRLEKLKAKSQLVPEPVAAVRQTPEAALERVAMDDSVRQQIVDAMKPGSSVIITDHGISNETGQYTDFIVLTNQ
ncbi:MAG: L,D-transpeptidase family protein [Hyphomicrobiaceae bacterium]|nr:L,D-transpeptidase family protein [Hyphomicrobiaceae bacterium]